MPDTLPLPEPTTEKEYLIQISTSLKLGFQQVHQKLDDMCGRLGHVETIAKKVEDYPTFKEDVYNHFRKYDEACTKSEG